MATLSLWALYRRLLRACPQWAAPGVWKCRPCGRLVKTRAALGAHFFTNVQPDTAPLSTGRYAERAAANTGLQSGWPITYAIIHGVWTPCGSTGLQPLLRPLVEAARSGESARKSPTTSLSLARHDRPCPSLSTQAGTRHLWWRTRTFVTRSWSTIFRRTPPSFVLGWRLSWDATPCSQRRR